MSVLRPTKLEKRNDAVWNEICALLQSKGFEMDRHGNMVKGEKGRRIRYKRKARNVRKEGESLFYYGKMHSHWHGIWSIPLSGLCVRDGKIDRV